MNITIKAAATAAFVATFAISSWAVSTDDQFSASLNVAHVLAQGFAKTYPASAPANMVNPAASRCAALGGRVKTFSTGEGVMGACAFGRALIEEWSLFRASAMQNNGHANIAVQSFIDNSSSNQIGSIEANPASTYCVHSSGALLMVTDAEGNAAGFCRFKDGSMIEEWTLLRGPKDTDGQKLAVAVKGR